MTVELSVKSRFSVGDSVRLWKPRHAEHGLRAVVKEVCTIQEYGGPEYRGPHAYHPVNGWRDERDERWFGGPFPDAMVCSEADYQGWRAKQSINTRP